MNPKELELIEQKKRLRKRFAEWWLSPQGQEILSYLEEYFQVNLPVFQGGIGKFDPLDAMRRDAYREVFLHIRTEIKLSEQTHEPRK